MAKTITESHRVYELNDDKIAYKLMRSKKRKRSISMKYNKQGQLQINVPHRMNQSIIDEFIVAKYQWIKTNQDRNNQVQSKKLMYVEGEKHQYKGAEYSLCLVKAGSSNVMLKDDQMVVFYRKNSSVKNVLDRWYKDKALEYLTQRTHYLADKFDFPNVKDIKIRNMTARWGSCNSLSEITYNTHLIKTGIESMDYVVLHELCHLIHHNHSSRFYQLQSKVNPDWKAQKQFLNHFVLL